MTQERKLTGWHVFAIFAGAFGVIIAVNLVLAFKAAGSFPGLVVKNSYVASQTFNDRKYAQESLGWSAEVSYDAETLVIDIIDKAGQPVQVAKLDVLIGRSTNVRDDIEASPQFNGENYQFEVALKNGNWVIMLKAKSLDGIQFEQRRALFVKG